MSNGLRSAVVPLCHSTALKGSGLPLSTLSTTRNFPDDCRRYVDEAERRYPNLEMGEFPPIGWLDQGAETNETNLQWLRLGTPVRRHSPRPLLLHLSSLLLLRLEITYYLPLSLGVFLGCSVSLGRRWHRLWTLPSAAWVLGFWELVSAQWQLQFSRWFSWAYCLLETTAHTPIVSCCASNQANESLAPENDVGIASVRTLVALRRRRTIEVAKIGIQAFLGRK